MMPMQIDRTCDEKRCLTFADCRLQTADHRLQTVDHRLQTVQLEKTLTDCWSQMLKTTELNPTQILDHVKEWVCVNSVINAHVYSKMTKEAYRGIITGRLAYSSMFFTMQKLK